MIAKNIALIGAGYWGKNLARNFNALGVLHTICDNQASILARYGGEYADVEMTTAVESVFANKSIACVAIAAPATYHYKLASAALLAGKDVYVEKPLCLDLLEATNLVALAADRKRILMVGHLLQYHPLIQKLRTLVMSGDLGKLYYITSNRLNLGKIRREENALWSFAPHDISVILSLLGNSLPEQVRCLGQANITEGIADTTLTTLKFSNGTRAHIYVSWLNPFKEQKLTIVGSNGMAVFDDTKPWTEKLSLFRDHLVWSEGLPPSPSKTRPELISVPEAEPLREECLHLLNCLENRMTPRTDGEEGKRVLQVLQSAQLSLDLDGEAQFPTMLA